MREFQTRKIRSDKLTERNLIAPGAASVPETMATTVIMNDILVYIVYSSLVLEIFSKKDFMK